MDKVVLFEILIDDMERAKILSIVSESSEIISSRLRGIMLSLKEEIADKDKIRNFPIKTP